MGLQFSKCSPVAHAVELASGDTARHPTVLRCVHETAAPLAGWLPPLLYRLALILLFAATPLSAATAQPPLWLRQIGTAGVDQASGVATDASGNAYITGRTEGNLGGTSAGGSDIFLAKYNPSGALLWIRQRGSSGYDSASGVAVDSLGNAYITGYTTGNLGATNAGDRDIFLAKYNPIGTLLWMRQIGSAGADSANGVAVDSAGNAYITGSTTGNLGGPSEGNQDIFLAKYDAGGTLLWMQQTGTPWDECATGVAVDGAGNAYIAGNGGYYGIFLAKYDASGSPLWMRRYGATAYDYASGVAADGEGNTYITGRTTLSAGSGVWNIFLARYNSSGDLLWTRQRGNASYDTASALGVAVDGTGNAYITGQTNGNLSGLNADPANITFDMFLTKYDSSGFQLWVRQIGTAVNEWASGVAVDSAGNAYMTGSTDGRLGGPNAGGTDILVAKYSPPPCISPSIAIQPMAITVCQGQTADFSVTAAGTGPFTYVWRKAGVAIDIGINSTAATPTLSLTGISPADAGSYTCAVTGACGVRISSAAALTVHAITTQPAASTTVCQTAAVTLRVVASGTAPIWYQWRKNGVNINGATGATYAVATATTGGSGVYSVSVTGRCGSITSNDALVTVNPSTVITAQPTSITRCTGTEAVFSVTATGTTPVTYQWRRNGIDINGATNSTLLISSVGAANAGSYTVVVTSQCRAITSARAVLTITTPPTITVQPVSLTRCTGVAAVFTVAATGTAPITFQWRENGFNIPGATTNRLTIASPTLDSTAAYDVVVTNSCDTVTSSAAVLNVNSRVAIISQPTTSMRCTGSTASFSVSATGSEPITYQWRKNGVNIAGATSSAYLIGSVVTANAGSYTVVVTGPCGPIASTAAVLVVTSPPTITTQPVSLTQCSGTNATFRVVATGTAPLTYQWRKDGVDISGATLSSYIITAVTPLKAGSYTCRISNGCGSTISNPGVFTVNVPPGITSQPHPVAACTGASATFAVVVAPGSGAIRYQWRKGTVNIAGATGATYTIPSIISSSIGSYSVVITGPCGTAVTSAPATLTLNVPTAIGTPPADSTVCSGSTATFTVAASGSGTLAYQWKKNSGGGPVNLTDGIAPGGSTISGSATSTLTITAATSQDAAAYSCIVTSPCGGTAATPPATLTVNNCGLNVGPCSLADIAGGPPTNLCGNVASPSPDGTLDGSDFIAFINSFAAGDVDADARADVAGGGLEGLDPDGIIDGTDFIIFINVFATGC